MELRAINVPVTIRAKPLMTCAQCGEAIHMAKWSEYLDEHRLRHEWECEVCGYSFETLARFIAH